MKRITLLPLQHKNEKQIAVQFDFDDEIKAHLREIELVRWSKTHQTFYLPYSWKNQQRLYVHLRAKNWFVDYSALVQNKREPTTVVFEKKTLGTLSKTHETLVEAFYKWMLQQRYSENSAITYCGILKIFFRFYCDRDISNINNKDFIRFNQHYIMANGYSRAFQTQAVSALKLFYRKYNNTDLDMDTLERPKKERRLPEVLSPQEIFSILSNIKNIKHRTLLSLVYACGLRIGEALHLRLTDIDSDRGFLHIKQAKGAKDRYVPLSDKTLAMLKNYYGIFRPKDYLFEGQYGGLYSQASARKILYSALRQTLIAKRVTLHTLRHSFATHLLENGTDIRYIQDILGHNSPKTTMIYTHVSSTSLKKIKNPFDDIDL